MLMALVGFWSLDAELLRVDLQGSDFAARACGLQSLPSPGQSP